MSGLSDVFFLIGMCSVFTTLMLILFRMRIQAHFKIPRDALNTLILLGIILGGISCVIFNVMD